MSTGEPKVFVMPICRRRIGSLVTVLLLTATGLLLSAPQALAQNNQWLPTATTWEDNTSWSLGSPPTPSQVAEFPANGNIFVFYAVSHQIGQALFGSTAAAYTFGAGGANVALQFNAPAVLGGIGINNQSGVPQEFGSGLLTLGASQSWATTQAGGNTIIDVPVNGTGLSLTKTGPGNLTFTANATLNVSNFNAQGGTTVFDRPPGSPTMAAGTINVGTASNPATLQLGGDINNTSNAIDPTNVTITIGTNGTLDSAQNTTHQLGNVTIQGGRIAGNASGAGVNFTFIDGSTVSVTGTTQSSVIDAPRGIQLTTAGGAVNFSVANGFSGSTGSPDLIVNAPISGVGQLNKNGTGIMRLTASNITYSGPINVNAGTLQLTSTGGTGTGTTTVASTATLMGNGTIGGSMSVQSGGTVVPNVPTNNNPGRLTQPGGNTDFASGSTFGVRIGGDGNDDTSRSQLNMTTGTLTFPNSGTGTWTVDVSKVATYNPTTASHTYTIATAGSIPSTGLDTPVTLVPNGTAGQTATNGTTTLRITGFAAGGSFSLQRVNNTLVLNYNPVPEPVAVLAVFGAGIGFAAWRRRTRQLTSTMA
jgi:autotransporter-associated beta strand protein